MTVRNRRSLIALLVSVVLMLSLFTVSAFATEENSSEVSEASSEEVSSESSSESSSETGSESSSESSSESKSESSTANESTGTTASGEDDKNNSTELIVNLVIGGVIIIIAVVLIIKNRVKLAAFLRSVKSELKKIVWSPKDQTRKNFLVVIVVCVLVTLLVWVLDLAFETGVGALSSLFSK